MFSKILFVQVSEKNLEKHFLVFSPFKRQFTKWSNTLKQFVGKLPTNCLSMFDRFVGLALKGLKLQAKEIFEKIYKLLI